MANLKPHPFSVHPVAKALGVHAGTLIRLAERGVLPEALIFQASNGRWRVRDASAEQEIKALLEMWKPFQRKPRASRSHERQEELESHVFGQIFPPDHELLALARATRPKRKTKRGKPKNIWTRLKQAKAPRAETKRPKSRWASAVLKFVGLNETKMKLLKEYDLVRSRAIEAPPPHPSLHPLRQLARKEWALGKKPITNKQLADLMETKPAVFTDRAKASTPMPIVLRTGTNGGFDLYFDSAWSTSRRFASSRLLGDYLHHSNGGRLIPATNAKTSRQQFQRAFAQEFLCPFDALMEKIQTDQPDEDDIAEAASFFEVSPWVVQTTLVNKGELDRETLNWVA